MLCFEEETSKFVFTGMYNAPKKFVEKYHVHIKNNDNTYYTRLIIVREVGFIYYNI